MTKLYFLLATACFLLINLRAQAQQTTWTGAVSTDWFTAGNWTAGVPTANDAVLINASTNNRPSIQAGTARARTVSLFGNLFLSGQLLISPTSNETALTLTSATLTNFGTITIQPVAGATGVTGVLTQNNSLLRNVGSIIVKYAVSSRALQLGGNFTLNNELGSIVLEGALASVIQGNAAFNNTGSIAFTTGLEVIGSGSLSLGNNSCGEFITAGDLPLTGGSSNSGFLQVGGTLTTSASFTNNGVLTYSSLSGSVTNNQVIVNNDPITPIFTYGATANVTVNGIFTDAIATNSAGTFTAPNSFTPSASLPSGLQTLYAKITPSGGACSYVVPFTYRVLKPAITGFAANSTTVCVGEGLYFSATISNVSGSYDYEIIIDGSNFSYQGSSADKNIRYGPIVTNTPGQYSYTLQVRSNGQRTTAGPITVTVNPLPTAYNVTGSGSYCSNGTGWAVGLSGSQSGVSYQLLRGGSAVGNAQSGTGNPLDFGSPTAGTYTVLATNTSTSCQQSMTGSAVITATQAPTATLTNDGPITCAKPTVTLTAGGGGSYVFSSAATQVNGGNTATVTQEGTYTVTVTSNGCSSFTTTTVNSNTAVPTATLSNNGPLSDNNPTVTLTATGGGTYAFSQGATPTGNGTATVTTPGIYQVTVTRASNGCSATASTTVTGGVNQTICRSGTAVINVVASGNPVRYDWYRNGTNTVRMSEIANFQRGTSTASLTLINQQATASYYVRVTDANGSSVVYGPIKVTVNMACNAYARVGLEELALQISLLGNPINGDRLRAVIGGAAGKALNVQLLDLSGKLIRSQQWQQAESNQVVEWSLWGQPSGVYLLQATTAADANFPDQRQSVKVVKP